MKKLRTIIIPLFLIFLLGCSDEEISDNSKKEYSKAEQFITDMGYLIISNEGIVSEYLLDKKLLTEMPYIQYWSVQSVDPIDYIGKEITTSKLIVKNHPLDNEKDNTKKQTLIFLLEADDEVIGGYSFPDFDELHMGWVYTIDGKTLEELTGEAFPNWSKEWNLKYK
ncbi:hypothetical protein BSK66_23620 [Paenibacillus odorifer]|uniref:DUF4830 domain-containing protein n=1 Tax=Paenibacillus odorifer TaxID=189426 RepID=A0A1R0X3M6_9BACL|nr:MULTISPECIES: hypothetical protein [Paenibacillus]ETT61218.1 hypothetical protein C171_13260 [Paenibacillus sp. FSL H8-237]OMD27707.1 hypothetical protein BJP51_24640 [Paenibacillus odorifer]OME51003.1 hypothetical protein BSK61_20615 [Paenibacillus odorifer]OME51148.1 hypothetical protein BSK66_23620 [Paenibacillus odorifer]